MSILNIVATAKTNNRVDFELIEKMIPDSCYRSPSFGSLNVKDSVTSLLQIFKNGKLLVIGGRSEEEAMAIFEDCIKMIVDLGHPLDYLDYKISNIVASYRHDKSINLHKLAETHNLEFNPEIFPAVRRRYKKEKVTVNIFHTGSCVILGAKSAESVSKTVLDLESLLKDAESRSEH